MLLRPLALGAALLTSLPSLAQTPPAPEAQPAPAAPAVSEQIVAPGDAAAAGAGDAAAPDADGRTLVAVLDLKASAGAEPSAQALATMLTAEVSALAGHKAISRNELKSILIHQADAQLAGCTEMSCMGDVANLVNAKRVLTGEVTKLEGAIAVSLTLVDTSDAAPRIAARQEAAWRGRDDELLLLARPLVQRLFDAANAGSHVGAIEVFTVEGATVIIDGREVGVTPLAGPLRELQTGVHSIKVQKDGYHPYETDLVVARNETTLARADLEELALTDQPWFWAAAGGVVLVAGGTAAGITTWAFLNAPQDTRVVLGKPAQ